MLKSLEFSFGMFCQNLQTYRAMREQGEMDFLTGLSNRNRFEVDLAEFAKEDHERMACIYIDVNGLHERNNSEGHEAGDRMLKAVAKQIRSRFGERYCYRIGGDEFVVFTLGMPEEMVKQLAEELKKVLEKDGIYVSVGLCWKEKVSIIDPFVRSAEKQMYAAKKKFYEQEAHDRRRFRK